MKSDISEQNVGKMFESKKDEASSVYLISRNFLVYTGPITQLSYSFRMLRWAESGLENRN